MTVSATKSHETPSSYLMMDLSPSSDTAKHLLARLKQDSEKAVIPLTPENAADGAPAFLTPEMSTWFNTYVQPARRSSIQEVVNYFQTSSTPGSDVHGCLFEYERDRTIQFKFQNIEGERQEFLSKTNIQRVDADLKEKRLAYALLKQQHGRDALPWRPYLYWSALILVIFLLEGIINLESFLKIPGFTPALSVGSFLCVSIALAASAHLLGKTIKQWRDLLGGSVSGTEKRKNVFILSLAIVLFLLALAFVAYARWFLIADVLMRKAQLSGGELGTEEILQFSGTLFGNFIVYALGVVWSFVRHDSVPGFSEARFDLEKLKRREDYLIEKHLARRNRQHINAAQRALALVRAREQAQALQLPQYQQGRRLFDAVREQDVRVASLLDGYRNQLLDTLRRSELKPVFAFEDVTKLAVDITERMSADEYAAKPIELRYC